MRYSETLERKMSERKSRRGRKITLTDSAHKRKKKDSTAKSNQARICIVDQYDRWMEIKMELNVKTHAEVAKFLIVRSTNRQEDGSSIPKKRLDEIDPNSIHIQKLTSTPGPGSHFMVVPSDVSEITSSDHDPVNSNNEMSSVEEMHSVSHTEGTTKCHQKSTPCNMTSTFVNPFESTAEWENFQNLILMYASKRIAYRPPAYRSRNLLAAIDHNRHINRPSIGNRDGTLRYQRSFNKKVDAGQLTLSRKIKDMIILQS